MAMVTGPSQTMPGLGGLPQAPSVEGLMGQMQAMDQSQAQGNLAAMMWQMQMASPHQNPAMMMPPPPPAMMMPPWQAPVLNVRVEGLKFEYQLTDDDVRKVFSRYGEVFHVSVDKEGTSATVQFDQPHHAMSAQHDLDRKQLAGMQGAYLRVDYPGAMLDNNPFAQAAQMAAASAAQSYPAPNPMLNQVPGYPSMPGSMQGVPGSPSSAAGRAKKYTCKLEVGIENEGEFRVGSRVIQIARQIWQDPRFQESGGKTRLRGKGVGGPHEADEPLALCISCKEQAAFEKAMSYAEAQLQKVHAEYKEFCQQKGLPPPELQVKVSKKGGSGGPSSAPPPPGVDPPRGERPPNAPTDEEIEKFIEERNEARKASNFKKSDEIRDYLRQRGVVLMDDKGAKGNLQGKEVTKWRFWRP